MSSCCTRDAVQLNHALLSPGDDPPWEELFDCMYEKVPSSWLEALMVVSFDCDQAD